MAVDSITGGAGIVPSTGTGDVTIDFDAPADLQFPGGPTLAGTVSTLLPPGSQRIASVNYVRAVAPPAGGAIGQVLAKRTAVNFEYEWVNQSGGPGGPVKAEDVSVDPATLIPVAVTDVQEALVDIYDRAVFLVDGGLGPGPVDSGWVIGNPAGGAMGPGTLNVENGIYIDGSPLIGVQAPLQISGGTISLAFDPDTLAVDASGRLTVIGGFTPQGPGGETPGGGAGEGPGGGAVGVPAERQP